MFRAMLIFVTIGAAYSQTCQQQYPFFHHNSGLLKDLDGDFFGTATSSERVIDCESITWRKVAGELEALIKSPGCCRRVHSPIYKSNEVTFQVDPINPREGCLTISETVSFKLVSKTGTGDDLCITFTACRQERRGVYVICKKKEISKTLLDEILGFLQSLVSNTLLILLGLPPLVYKTVNQQNCPLTENNCTPI